MIPNNFFGASWTFSLLAIALLAFLRGGPPEKLGATAVLLGYIATEAVKTRSSSWLGVQWPIFVVNGCVAGAMLAILLNGRRWWPTFASAGAILSLMMFALPVIDPVLRSRAYYFASIASDYVMLLSIGVGVVVEAPGGWLDRRNRGVAHAPAD